MGFSRNLVVLANAPKSATQRRGLLGFFIKGGALWCFWVLLGARWCFVGHGCAIGGTGEKQVVVVVGGDHKKGPPVQWGREGWRSSTPLHGGGASRLLAGLRNGLALDAREDGAGGGVVVLLHISHPSGLPSKRNAAGNGGEKTV